MRKSGRETRPNLKKARGMGTSASKYPLATPAELIGEWFLPSSPSTRIAGTLSWSVKKASLALQGTFTPLRGTVFGDEEHRYAQVHGLTTNSLLVTLLKALRTGTNLSIGQGGLRQSETLISSWVVVGAHVGADTRYREMRFRIPGLQIWLGRSGITQQIVSKTETSSPYVIYTVQGLPEEVMHIPCAGAHVSFGVDRGFSGDLITSFTVTTSASVRIRAEQPEPIDWFFAQLGKMTTLLSFMAGSPMAPDHVSAVVAESEQDVEILVALREAETCRHKRKSDFFMPRELMGAEIADVLTKWYGEYEQLALPSQLALSVLASRDLWLHVEFLSLMQALEGFHRATMDGLYTSTEAYELINSALASAIPASVEASHKASLKSRIKYGNEISLGKRIDALASRLTSTLRQLIFGGTGAVPRRWIETRNFYTHWDDAARDNALDGADMHKACVRLRLFLRVLYLDFVGIPQSAIQRSLANTCRDSQYLLQLNGEERRKQDPSSHDGALLQIDVSDPAEPKEPKEPSP